MHFFLVAHCLIFSHNQPAGGGGVHMAGGGMHRGGWGDARASCASPLGTPLVVDTPSVDLLWSAIRHSCWFLSPKNVGFHLVVIFFLTPFVYCSLVIFFCLSLSPFPFCLEPGLRIRIHFIRIRIQGRKNDQKLKKITAEKKIKFFFDQKLQFTYP